MARTTVRVQRRSWILWAVLLSIKVLFLRNEQPVELRWPGEVNGRGDLIGEFRAGQRGPISVVRADAEGQIVSLGLQLPPKLTGRPGQRQIGAAQNRESDIRGHGRR